ncbi:DUF4400 domain-containing protein [Luteimonas sp. MHLX1A]|uniref:DUF4400 domain-containing protein n=1 Tax=Alterluteimonas muca TaxID=2878684 RepID=UPI001E60D9D5|nr:DUF4400 domain-containing protein [Luteimonas sp. MHLX1A]MCD9046930.1 DUF4400 domain-containing protein [Luteimonas sp. MHLX1A]
MFGSNWYKVLMIAGAYLALYMALVGEAYLNRMVERESQINRQYFSDEAVTRSEVRATDWFNKVFVETEVMAHSFDMFIPSQAEIERSEGLDQDFGQPVFGWFERRLRSWWTLVWSTFTRASTMLIWAPIAPLFVVPWVIDGWTQRQRRKHTFEISSATRQHVAVLALTAVPLLLIVVITAPLVLHPMFAPAMLLLTGYLIYAAMANFMKRA